MLWIVVTNQHSEITLSFIIPGHTKFSPDWCFGLLKEYWWTKVGGLIDLCGVVNDSAAVNIAQPTRGWECCHHLRLAGILLPVLHKGEGHQEAAPSMVHVCFTFVKERAGSTEVKRSIQKDKNWKLKAEQLPPILPPTGISLQWQWHLYGEFFPDHLKDMTCPQPGEPTQDSSPSHSHYPSATPS